MIFPAKRPGTRSTSPQASMARREVSASARMDCWANGSPFDEAMGSWQPHPVEAFIGLERELGFPDSVDG